MTDPNVTDGVASPEVAPAPPAPEPLRPEGGKGKTLVKARVGYAFQSNDESIPAVTSIGVLVTQDQATALLDECAHIEPAPLLYIDTEKEG